MKLKKILFALAVLTSLASCSKDENKTVDWQEAGDASLSVQVRTRNVGTTKAVDNDKNALPGEAKINDMAVLVFDQSGASRIGYSWKKINTLDATATIEGVEAKMVNVQIAVFANVADELLSRVTSVSDLQSLYAALATQKQDYQSMSSGLITTQGVLAEQNYIGFGAGYTNINNLYDPLVLTRIAARIEISSFRTKFVGTKLAGETVRIDALSLLNVKENSYCFNAEDWGVVEVPNSKYINVKEPFTPITINDESTIKRNVLGYVYEKNNESAPTQIQIVATLLAANGHKEQTRTFTATINEKREGHDKRLIRRNYVYDLKIAFTEKSFSPESELSTLEVTVIVVPWGSVEQNVEI
ncbi:MAG: fimbrial protein [Tannerellaceae bacterium]